MFEDKNEGASIEESWAFIPYELYKGLRHLKNKTADKKVYGMDAPPAVYFDDKDGDGIVEPGDRVWAFFGMRRGGSSYYAFDISNPDAPVLK